MTLILELMLQKEQPAEESQIHLRMRPISERCQTDSQLAPIEPSP